MKQKLKECPFCGSENVVVIPENGMGGCSAHVECLGCGATIRQDWYAGQDKIDACKRAIELWNRRDKE